MLLRDHAGRSVISIHALLAESDTIRPRSCNVKLNFYPRSPCGERLDNIEITQANRQSLLFMLPETRNFITLPPFYAFQNFLQKVLTSMYTYGILYL